MSDRRRAVTPTIESPELSPSPPSDTSIRSNVIHRPPLRAPVEFLHLSPGKDARSMWVPMRD